MAQGRSLHHIRGCRCAGRRSISARNHVQSTAMSIREGLTGYYRDFGLRGVLAISAHRLFGHPKEIIGMLQAFETPYTSVCELVTRQHIRRFFCGENTTLNCLFLLSGPCMPGLTSAWHRYTSSTGIRERGSLR